jgi:hypothetical protein
VKVSGKPTWARVVPLPGAMICHQVSRNTLNVLAQATYDDELIFVGRHVGQRDGYVRSRLLHRRVLLLVRSTLLWFDVVVAFVFVKLARFILVI